MRVYLNTVSLTLVAVWAAGRANLRTYYNNGALCDLLESCSAGGKISP